MKLKLASIGILMLTLARAAMATEHTVSSSLDDGGAGTLRTLVATAASGDAIKIPEGMTIRINSQKTFDLA